MENRIEFRTIRPDYSVHFVLIDNIKGIYTPVIYFKGMFEASLYYNDPITVPFTTKEAALDILAAYLGETSVSTSFPKKEGVKKLKKGLAVIDKNSVVFQPLLSEGRAKELGFEPYYVFSTYQAAREAFPSKWTMIVAYGKDEINDPTIVDGIKFSYTDEA